MKREVISSSYIASFGFDKEMQLLEVEFNDGAIVRYYGVEPELIRRMRLTKSKGHFFGAYIRDAHKHRTIKKKLDSQADR